MTQIQNAKRLIPKYAREEKEKFRQRLIELGLETAAIKAKNQSLHNKCDQELYLKLEQNMSRLVSQGASHLRSSESAAGVKILNENYETNSEHSERYDNYDD